MDLRPINRYVAQMAYLETQAVRAALARWQQARNELLDRLARLGTSPSLSVALQDVLTETSRQIATDLRVSLAGVMQQAEATAAAQIDGPAPRLTEAPDLASGVAAWQAATQGQLLAETSRLRTSGAGEAAIVARLITGRDGRQSVYEQARTALQLTIEQAIWGAGNGALTRLYRQAGPGYRRQAIAAIDHRTTQCCLNVHGQIVGMDEPFVLTGTPRFADAVMAPPFHWRCRTALALYHPRMEAIGTSTEALRAQARAALRARSTT
jgi:hypothetical protein